MNRVSKLVGACLSAALLVACGRGSSMVLPPTETAVLPTSSVIPASQKVRLYVSGGRAIKVYKLPITGRSTPVAFLKTGKGEPTGMAFDSMGRLFVASLSDKVEVFTQPIVGGSVPSFTLATGTGDCGWSCPAPYNVTLDSTGNAVVAEDKPLCGFCNFGYIEVFTAPISKSSTVSYTLDGGYYTVTAGFNPNGNLFTELAPYCGSPPRPNRMYEYASPLHNVRPIKHFSVVACGSYEPTGLAFDSAGNMYLPTEKGLEVYRPAHPWRKLFTIKAAVRKGYLAFGPSGKLYVTTENRKLLVFSPPFSASSHPIVTLDLPHSPAGVAIGP